MLITDGCVRALVVVSALVVPEPWQDPTLAAAVGLPTVAAAAVAGGNFGI